jgi:hypothetical protein
MMNEPTQTMRFVKHYSSRSRWDASATLHRADCGKVPFTGPPGRKTRGLPTDDLVALEHAKAAETSAGYYKVCPCARQLLSEVAAEHALDRYGRVWNLPSEELCPECGQPDNCGDCDHAPLTDEEAASLREEG